MADQPDFGPLDVTDFTVGAMLRAGIAIRRAVRGADSLETAAELPLGALDPRPRHDVDLEGILPDRPRPDGAGRHELEGLGV